MKGADGAVAEAYLFGGVVTSWKARGDPWRSGDSPGHARVPPGLDGDSPRSHVGSHMQCMMYRAAMS